MNNNASHSDSVNQRLIRLITAASEKFLSEQNLTSEGLKIKVEIPKIKEHGDFSSNIAMQLAGRLNKPPIEIANNLCLEMKKILAEPDPGIDIKEINVKGPGFINFFLKEKHIQEILRKINSEGFNFGRTNFGNGKKVLIEFVSANPTGPLSVAHARQAAFGDSLANIMSFSGFNVTREYFINDEGNQIDLLAKSVYARYLELFKKKAPFPEDGYKGAYVLDVAKALKTRHGNKFFDIDARKFKLMSGFCVKFILKIIKKDLKDFGVKFDNWRSQITIHNQGKIELSLSELKTRGFLYEKDNAFWFKSTAFGDDKDRVVIKSDGSLTYLAPDIAYHKEKFDRGFESLINIWGPDHHGYIPRIKAVVSALGYNAENLDVLIVQLVTLYKAAKLVRMSKRLGDFISLEELIDEVGKDAARFFFLMRKRNSHLDFDLELAKKHSLDNPVYYIQYAHARISSIIRRLKRKYLHDESTASADVDLSLLKNNEELEIIKFLSQFPNAAINAAANTEPYIILDYLQKIAALFHSFYNKHRVISEDYHLTKARIVFVDSIRAVLSNGLTLLGVKPAKKM